jgi:hypothetical protein
MWCHTASRLIAFFLAPFCFHIKSGDSDSWYKEWNVTAERVFAEAEAQLAARHRITARDSYLRATISTSILSKKA